MKEWKQEEKGSGMPAAKLSEDDRAARDKALYYLQFSGKTEAELRKKLAEQGFLPASVDSAIAFLKHYRYLDDEDYVRRYIEKNKHKKSRKQMLYELRQKGVSADTLDQVFEEMPVDERAQIETLLMKKKYAGEAASREEKQKITAYLSRKGFSYDTIQSVLIHYGRNKGDGIVANCARKTTD